jgi:hypothetical protein
MSISKQHTKTPNNIFQIMSIPQNTYNNSNFITQWASKDKISKVLGEGVSQCRVSSFKNCLEKLACMHVQQLVGVVISMKLDIFSTSDIYLVR